MRLRRDFHQRATVSSIVSQCSDSNDATLLGKVPAWTDQQAHMNAAIETGVAAITAFKFRALTASLRL